MAGKSVSGNMNEQTDFPPTATTTDAAAAWPERLWILGLSVLTFLGALLFNLSTGLIVFMRDSQLLADRAKHLVLSGNLNLSNIPGAIVYPPLYPILISPAYLSSNPRTTFQLILVMHSLFVALQVTPYFKLLTEYSKVPARYAVWLALALSLAPFTLPYATMMLTEVVYFPLLLWMTYFFLRFQEEGKPEHVVRVGVLLALMMLVRTAAASMLVAAGAAMAWSLWQQRRNATELKKRFLALGVLFGAFLVSYGIWKVFESLFVLYGEVQPYFRSDDIKIIFAERKRFDHHFAWLTNTFFYYMTAPLSIAGFFFYSLVFRRFRSLLRDPLFPLAILSLLVSAGVVILVMTWDWGGRELTWNKYLAPYVFFLVIVSLRYRGSFTRSQFKTSVLALSLVFLSMKPSGLVCHFTDALVFFTAASVPVAVPETLTNSIYLVATILPAWLWLSGRNRSRAIAIAITSVLWFVSLAGTSNYYRNSGDLNISQYKGAALMALDLAKKDPQTRVYFAPNLTDKEMFGGSRVLFVWPELTEHIAPEKLAERVKGSNAPFLYFSDDEIGDTVPLAEERGVIRLYKGTPQLLAAADPARLELPLAGGSATAKMGKDVWSPEVAMWGDRKYPVRWLQANTSFTIKNEGQECDATVRMFLDVAAKPHVAELVANGTTAAEKPQVTKVLWVNGPQELKFKVRLKAGLNEFHLTSPDAPDELPGGRRVQFLLVGDIVASPL